MHVLFACNHAKVPLQTSCDPSSPCGSVSSLFHSSPIINKNYPKRPVLSDSEDGIGSSDDGVENGDGEDENLAVIDSCDGSTPIMPTAPSKKVPLMWLCMCT